MRLDKDPERTNYLLPYYRFMKETVRFDRLSPSPGSLASSTGSEESGSLPLCLVDRESDVTVVYFPTPGRCELRSEDTDNASYRWFNPRTGKASEIGRFPGGRRQTFDPPGDAADANDWVLVLDDPAKGYPLSR